MATTERDLVKAFCDSKRKLDALKEQVELASAEHTTAESALLDHLEATQATATAHYDGLGYIKLNKPRLYASVKQEDLPSLIEFVTAEGRSDLVKQVINPQSLSSYVSERIENGKTVPPQVTYFLKPQPRIYGA